MKALRFFEILVLMLILALGIITVGYAQDDGTLTLEGHTDAVTSVVFSPDSTVLASSSADGTIRLWDSATGEALFILEGHTGEVNQVDFSPDGTLLASAGEDRAVRLWDVVTGQEADVLEGHTDAVLSVSFNTEGTLASGSADSTIRLWDVESGETIQVIEGHEGAVKGVDFNPQDAEQLASIGADNTVRLWNVVTGEEINQDESSSKCRLFSVAFNPDGLHVAIGYIFPDSYGIYSAYGMVWDTATGDLLRPGMPAGVGKKTPVYIAWSPVGDELYISQAFILNFSYIDATLEPGTMSLGGGSSAPHCITYSPDGSMIALGSADSLVYIFP
ncbi:MAG: WD40 repeat domain-containing protein [Anaerolineae bacterium]|nr:WD40 repeat domain-containing protein [Anaerolineae bacterium]